MGDWIQTISGGRFSLLDPKPQDVRISDIAHALARICRFNGHTKTFYSVAQHSVIVSEELPEKHRLWGLLHDASEAYICDIPTPLKSLLSNYKQIEKKIMQVIAEKFDLEWPMPECVHEADLVVLNTEKRDLLNPSQHKWDRSWIRKPLDRGIAAWSSPSATDAFISRYRSITE